jgi:hypothetical protein
MLMVNWREDVEFCYVLFILISAIVVFFSFYDSKGVMFAGGVAVILVVVEAVIGVAAFETDRAISAWEKIGKNEPAK